MGHGELFELVQKLLKEKEEKPKPQAICIQTPPPHLILQKVEIYLTQE